MAKFCNYNYNFWTIDLSPLKASLFDQEFNDAFLNEKVFTTPETIGYGKTLHITQIPNFKSYNLLLDIVTTEIQKQQDFFNISFFYRKRMKLKRVWANRFYEGSMATTHFHPDSTVFLIYYTAPENSSQLVFIDKKHSNNLNLVESEYPAADKLYIPVKTGTSVIHDGKILHAVSAHKSDQPRDVIVFDFPPIFY